MQLGLAQFTFTYQTLWPQLMAGSLIAILPILVIFLVFQRFFIAGVTAAGSKDEAARRVVARAARLLRQLVATRRGERRARRRLVASILAALALPGRGRAHRRRGARAAVACPLLGDARANRGSHVRRRMGGTAPPLAAWPPPRCRGAGWRLGWVS